MFGTQFHHMIQNWTQSDLRFCKNEGSKRSKIIEKRLSIGLKMKDKIDTKCLKTVK